MKFAGSVGLVVLALLLLAATAVPAYAVSNPPGPPTSLTASPGDSKVTLTWTPPQFSLNKPTGYQVTTQDSNGVQLFQSTVAATTTSSTIQALNNGFNYRFLVASVNSNGTSTADSASAAPFGPAPVLNFSPAGLTFASGSTTAQAVVLSNSGSAAMNGGNPSIGIRTSVSQGFVVDGSGCAMLAGGASCQVLVTAQAAGPLTGSLTFTDNVPPTGTQSIPLTIATPAPTPSPTPQGSVSLVPSAAPPATRVTLSGSGLPPGQTLSVLWDGTSVDSVTTDGAGSFSKDVAVPDAAPAGVHQLCVMEAAGNLCLAFTVQAPTPSPSPSPSDSPSPSPSPVAAASAGGGSDLSPVAILTRPPFVFFPIVLLLALVGGLGYWAFSRRPGPTSVTVLQPVRRSERYESYQEPPTVEPPPSTIVYETPESASTPPPQAAPRPPAPGSEPGADVPPELPEASD